MRSFLITIAVALLSSCAAQPLLPPVPVQKEIVSLPEEGQVSTANLGETLLTKYEVSYRPALEILEPESWTEVLISWNLPTQKLRAIGLGADGKPARWRGTLKDTKRPSLDFAVYVDRNTETQVLTARNSLTVYSHGLKAPTRDAIIEEPSETDFKQELIYNGRVGDDLRFVYREFASRAARSAFSQEAQYDLQESNIIGFKGARIEVLEATNSSIRYRVISNF